MANRFRCIASCHIRLLNFISSPWVPIAENIHIDGSGLPITHADSIILPSSSQSFTLNNVLCVLSMKKNLILVSQICTNNNVSIEFSLSSFYVINLLMRAPLLQGTINGGVYKWPRTSPKTKLVIAFSSIKVLVDQWHHHLGHLPSNALRHLISNKNLSPFNFQRRPVHAIIFWKIV